MCCCFTRRRMTTSRADDRWCLYLTISHCWWRWRQSLPGICKTHTHISLDFSNCPTALTPLLCVFGCVRMWTCPIIVPLLAKQGFARSNLSPLSLVRSPPLLSAVVVVVVVSIRMPYLLLFPPPSSLPPLLLPILTSDSPQDNINRHSLAAVLVFTFRNPRRSLSPSLTASSFADHSQPAPQTVVRSVHHRVNFKHRTWRVSYSIRRVEAVRRDFTQDLTKRSTTSRTSFTHNFD